MQICVIGTGFVGVVTAAVFASFGHQVIGLDVDPKKVKKLTQGVVPFFEPGLSELLQAQLKAGRVQFTTEYSKAIPNSQLIMIAVGTPSSAEGQVDLKYVFAAVDSLATHLTPGSIVAIKSTVPPGTLTEAAKRIRAKTEVEFTTASLPEFLREGSAVEDTLHPDRVVVGSDDDETTKILTELHQPMQAPIFHVSPSSAQMAKYTANAYLATRITFINQIADLCEHNGANVMEVIKVIGADKRIGSHYWYPGLGYGGSCFPKDVKELAYYSRQVGEDKNLLNNVNRLNEDRIERLLRQWTKQVGSWDNKKVAVLGLSFKPHTDDIREAPSTKLIPQLLKAGATVKAYDPKVEMTAELLPVWTAGLTTTQLGQLSQESSIEKACADADVILAVIEWPEIISFEYQTVRANKPQWFIDARNQCSSQTLQQAGYTYLGIGL